MTTQATWPGLDSEWQLNDHDIVDSDHRETDSDSDLAGSDPGLVPPRLSLPA